MSTRLILKMGGAMGKEEAVIDTNPKHQTHGQQCKQGKGLTTPAQHSGGQQQRQRIARHDARCCTKAQLVPEHTGAERHPQQQQRPQPEAITAEEITPLGPLILPVDASELAGGRRQRLVIPDARNRHHQTDRTILPLQPEQA